MTCFSLGYRQLIEIVKKKINFVSADDNFVSEIMD